MSFRTASISKESYQLLKAMSKVTGLSMNKITEKALIKYAESILQEENLVKLKADYEQTLTQMAKVSEVASEQ